jgi:hypothetical protein
LENCVMRKCSNSPLVKNWYLIYHFNVQASTMPVLD